MKTRFSRSLALVLALVLSVGMLTNTAFATGTSSDTTGELIDETIDELAGIHEDGTEGDAQGNSTETDPVEEYVFNPGTTGSNFSIKEVGSATVTYAKDTGYGAPMTLEAGKTYEFWSRWEYDADATVGATDIGFNFSSAITTNANQKHTFSVYAAYGREYSGEDTETIWYKAAENLQIKILTDTIKIWSDGALGDGLTPDPTTYHQANNYLYNIPIGYDALDGNFKPGQVCYVSLRIATQATEPATTEGNNAGDNEPADATNDPATPPVDEPTEEYDPTLPRVFTGEVDSSSRELFTEENRPDYAVFNSVTNNADYGDESKFLRITDLTTGDVYQEGVVELVPGRQYQVDIYYRNDATYNISSYGMKFSRDADRTYLYVTMPYELTAGTTERFSATITAENTKPLAVSTGLDLTSQYGLYLEYADGSAVWQKNGGSKIEAVDYEDLFRDGVRLGDIGSESYGTVSFTIRATSDGTTAPADLPVEPGPNSSTTRTLGDKIWNVYLPTVVASVLITLLVIAGIIILLDLAAPPLHSIPIIRHCSPMPPIKTRKSPETPEAPAAEEVEEHKDPEDGDHLHDGGEPPTEGGED